MVGNDFVQPRPRLQLAATVAPEPAVTMPITPLVTPHQEAIPVSVRRAPRPQWGELIEQIYRQSFIIFSLLFLLVAASGIEVGGHYWSARLTRTIPVNIAKHTLTGLSLNVPAAQLQAKIQAIAGQPASLTVGSQTVPISPETIKGWLKISASADKSQDYIYVKSDAINQSLSAMARSFAKSPVNQVTVTHDGIDQVVVAGRDGATLSDPSTLATQAHSAAKTVMDARGLQFSTPLSVQAFQAVTPAAFAKLIEVNVVTKQMYLYDNGSLTRSYPISAGAPATPTPIGEYHVYAKYATQDMNGYNANGTKYFQPHVHWINYFLPGGYAVHGNYWRPPSWFGVINSSHGCVSLPDAQAQWVYSWTPVGTTVITHS